MARKRSRAEGSADSQPGARGRPTTFTAEIGAKICQKMRTLAVPLTIAAESERVPASTVCDWVERGDQGDPRYAEFAIDVMQAEAQAACTLSARTLGGKSGAGSAAWMLERRFPKHFGRREKLKVTGIDYAPMVVRAVEQFEEIQRTVVLDPTLTASVNADLARRHEEQRQRAEAKQSKP